MKKIHGWVIDESIPDDKIIVADLSEFKIVEVEDPEIGKAKTYLVRDKNRK